MRVVCAGIGTEIGKSYASIALCAALKLEYFKIIQAGLPQDKDLLASFGIKTHENGFFVKAPLSPHLALEKEGLSLDFKSIKIPATNELLLECAGGLYSPLNHSHTMIDFIAFHKLPVFLVINEYLGSINHSLLSIKCLQDRAIPIKSLIFRGKEEGINKSSADFIKKYSKIKGVFLDYFDKDSFASVVCKLKLDLKDYIY